MGALAGMLHDAGYQVTGSDTGIYPPMSDYLASLGIEVMQGWKASNLDHEPDLVVVGNVMRAEYEESQATISRDLPYCSFPHLLGERFLRDAHSTVIAGTHGKTTTTAITAWLLEAAGLNPGFLIGGIVANFPRTARAGGGEHFVIEGDEYDTAFFDKQPKFLHYRPDTVVLTSVEFDHADIYQDLDHVKRSFRQLMQILPESGLLIVRADDPGAAEVAQECTAEIWRYGPGSTFDGRIEQIDTDRGLMRFTVLREGRSVGTFESRLVGEHNLYNQVAATAAALRAGASPQAIAQGFSTFLGIKRRQEVLGEPGGVTVVDDFAHHPTAVRLTLQALRQRFGERRLWAIWEPRSATSRRDVFQSDYASAFDAADRVLIAAPYDQSRIPEQERFSAERLVRDLSARGLDALTLDSAAEIAGTVAAQAHPRDVVAVLSNGGFDGIHGQLLDLLALRFGASEGAPS
ncbi:MAG: UDP-N-acetylmuramate:L-alanyl-gamma-D-glutamyl-meso-diaminopimelate ligase [Deltaproteobacteria bacterium]|nr:MAG: UDP-N-acetylmuramate:L-alanyl-gamma-D-glutamyl-meso-diaminopimelate ligase [Deltaproteobacteria bacterium]